MCLVTQRWRTKGRHQSPSTFHYLIMISFPRTYLKPTLLNSGPFIIKLRPARRTRLVSSSAQMFSSRRGDSDKIGGVDEHLSNGLILLQLISIAGVCAEL